MKTQLAFNISDKVHFAGVQPPGTAPSLNRFEVYCVRDVLSIIGKGVYIRLAGVECPRNAKGEELWFDARHFTHASVPAEKQTSGFTLVPLFDSDDPALQEKLRALRERRTKQSQQKPPGG